MIEGNKQAKLLIVTDFLRVTEAAENRPLAGTNEALLVSNLRKAGLTPDDYAITILFPFAPPGFKETKRISEQNKELGRMRLKQTIKDINPNLIITLGSEVTFELTGLSLHKYQSSIIRTRAEYGSRKCIPCYHPQDIVKNYSDLYFMALSLHKAAREHQFGSIEEPQRKFLLGPPLKIVHEYIEDVVLKSEHISVDIETGRGQINTVGFAPNATEAIAINVLPEKYSASSFSKLWQAIQKVCQSSIPKVAQNALYEYQCLSRYGVKLNQIHHDTMWCMKFLNPELKAGLDNVGRVYTPFPYWKDDNEDWNNVRDWLAHYQYNCSDTTGTMWAFYEQEKELKERNLHGLFYDHIMLYHPLIQEMTHNGLPLCEQKRQIIETRLASEIEGEFTSLQEIFLERLGREVNPRSPLQLKPALVEMGFKLPSKKKKDGELSDSTDKAALIKLGKAHPKEKCFTHLINLSKKNKLMSSYVRFKYDQDAQVRYSLNGVATETGRWNCRLDPQGNGFNAQTVPKSMRTMFEAPPGYSMMQIDLAQAESRYVAWEGPEPTLMRLIEEGMDIHKYVAAKIFKVKESQVTKQQRQLGKKSGHSANYGVGPRTFAEACFVEMGLKLSESEARRIIDGYYEVFPGIYRRQQNIQKKIRDTRFLRTPLGRERYFYERMGDKIFREAYAYCPQSTIPDITNHLILYLHEEFFDVKFLIQVHDSVVLLVPNARIQDVIDAAKDCNAWHPEILLPGGKLIIPVDIELGPNWLDLDAI